MHPTFTDPSASLSPPGAVVFAGAAKLGGSDVHEWSFRVDRGTGNSFGVMDALKASEGQILVCVCLICMGVPHLPGCACASSAWVCLVLPRWCGLVCNYFQLN